MSPTNFSRYKYNPNEIDESSLVEKFVIRTREFDDLYHAIQTADYQTAQQHYIILGQRGQGKTTLLRRLMIAIEQDTKLSEFLVPVQFAEEQYQIRTLSRLWEEVADYLQAIHPKVFAHALDNMEAHFDDPDYEMKCFSYLENYVKTKQKKLVLLIDNIDELLGKLKEKEQRQLREILISSTTFRIVGGSSKMIEQAYDYGKPFYEFFQFIRLQGLNKEDCNLFLKTVGTDTQKAQIEQIIANSPQRIETLRRLTGGVPRTMLMLFDIFIDDTGNAFDDLLLVLDDATPLYKHRMDDLPPVLQDITHVIAMNWDGIGTKEIAAKTRLESKVVSAQLKQLEKKYGIVSATSIGKNKLYQLEERFFNIWYLMRFGRKRDRQRVEWLVRFLNAWCTPTELETRAQQLIHSLNDNKVNPIHAYHMCEALSYAGLNAKTEYELKENMKTYLHNEGSNLANSVTNSVNALWGKVQYLVEQGSFDKALAELDASDLSTGEIHFSKGVIYSEKLDFEKAEHHYLKAIESGRTDALNNLGALYLSHQRFELAEQYFLQSIDKGDHVALNNLGITYYKINKNELAEFYYLKAIDAGVEKATHNIIHLYTTQQNFKHAEQNLRRAISGGNENLKIVLVGLLFEQGINSDEALELIEKQYNNQKNEFTTILYCFVLLWNEKFQQSFSVFDSWLRFELAFSDANKLNNFFMLLLAKGQYHQALKLMEHKDYQLKDRLKPVWYTLVSLMPEEFPHELKKMGPELQETVDEILETVKQMEKKYEI